MDNAGTAARAGERYSTRIAANGWEALLAVETPPSLILLDIMLPGMDGFMFLNSLRGQRTHQAIPVVVLTAMDVAEVVSKVRPHGVEHVISKGDNVFPQLKTAIGSAGYTAAARAGEPAGAGKRDPAIPQRVPEDAGVVVTPASSPAAASVCSGRSGRPRCRSCSPPCSSPRPSPCPSAIRSPRSRQRSGRPSSDRSSRRRVRRSSSSGSSARS